MHKLPRAFDNGTEVAEDVSKRSDDSAAMVNYWDKTDAIVGGIKTMREAKGTYLPRFPSEEKDDFDFRLEATKLTNVYRDIVEGLSSKPFEEEVSLVGDSIPADITKFIENVDGRGDNLTAFAAATFFNGINSAIDWIFIDYPKVNKDKVKTQKDQKAAGIRPFWSHVLGRNVLTAQSKIVGDAEILTLVRILEPGKPDHIREFVRNEKLNPNTGKIEPVVNWILYEKKVNITTGQSEWIQVENGNISIGVIPLVPFATGRRDGAGFKYFPAMQDAADLQIELYQQESALKFAKIMAAYPMLAGNGVKPEKSVDGKSVIPIRVGPMKVLYAPPNGNGDAGSWAFIEPAATSLTFLAGDIKETKTDLRELGRQPLTAQSGNLTVISSAVAASKSKSAVGAWTLALKNALENAFIITGLWMNETAYKPEVNVYTDFDNFIEGDTDLEHLRAMRDSGDLSQDTLWVETKRRRVLSSEFDAEKEIEKLLDEVPGDEFDDDGEPIENPDEPELNLNKD